MTFQISLLHQFEEHKDETFHICFSLDGNTLWSSDQIALYQWQRYSGDIWSYCRCIPAVAYNFQCTADGKMLVFWDGEQKCIRFLSYDGKDLVKLSHPDQDLSFDFALSPDQRWLVTGGEKGNLLLWDMVKHQWSSISVPDWPGAVGEPASYYCFRFALGGLGLIFITSGHEIGSEEQICICHFDPEHDHYAIRRILPLSGIQGMKVFPDGKLLAITCVDFGSARGVYVYDLEELQLLQKFPAPVGTYYDLLAFSPDGRFLASSRDNGILDIWSLTTFECAASFEAHQGPRDHERHWSETIGGLDWSTTGYLATGGTRFKRFDDDMAKEDLSIRIWKIEEKLV